MRYVTVQAIPTESEAFHPLGKALAADPEIERGSITKVELLSDGTGILLGEMRGNVDRYRELLAASEYVLDFSVIEHDDVGYSYTQFEPTELTEQMLAVRYETGLMMEMPITIDSDGAMTVTLVGPQEEFDTAMATLSAEPAEYTTEILETGAYHPDLDELYLSLTERQREVLNVAVECGYYDTPRAATHEAIAREIGLSPSTVGEHLQKIESRVFSQLVR